MKRRIDFRESTSPVDRPVTKFGGQPVWVEKPSWPLSRSTGKPMTFICQIALDKAIFGELETRMAYIFMSDDESIPPTWEPDAGENAVVIQRSMDDRPTIIAEPGPTIAIWKEVPEKLRKPFPCEFLADLSEASPDVCEMNDELPFENKIGGVPQFLQGEEFPDGDRDRWNLLVQLDSCSIPFDVNFGDTGVGYAFISKDGKIGKFLWQCT